MSSSVIWASPLRFGFLGAASSARDWRPLFFVDIVPVQPAGFLDCGPLAVVLADQMIALGDDPATAEVGDLIVTYPLHGVPPVPFRNTHRHGPSVSWTISCPCLPAPVW